MLHLKGFFTKGRGSNRNLVGCDEIWTTGIHCDDRSQGEAHDAKHIGNDRYQILTTFIFYGSLLNRAMS